MATRYDALVIGTGQAGPPLAARLSEEGLRVAVVERKLVGGTCVNTGCIPTKALIASAQVAHMARCAGDYGVEIGGPVAVDMKRVKARMDAIVGASRDGVTKWMQGLDNGRFLRGHARFESARTVRVGGELLEAEKIFINTGARAAVPDIKGLHDVDYLTNSSMVAVDFLPEHLVVIGGSYVGLEFAQMYRRFGSRVTVVEMAERLIAREDPDVSEAVRAILAEEGVEIRLNAKCIAVERDGSGIAVGVDCAEGAPRIHGSHLLLAVGRQPNSDDLGLDAAGVATDKRGHITVDEQLRTNVDGIWALGEVNGRGAFTHTSYNDYEIVAANLFDGAARKVSDRIACYGLFTEPPLGRCGMSEGEARRAGHRLLVARLDMKSVSRARVRSETQGFLKLVVDADSRKILGAAFLGLSGDEVMHTVLDLMYAGAPYTLLERVVHAHPTVAEYLPVLVGKLEPAA